MTKNYKMLNREDALSILKDSGCSEEVIEHCITVADLALEIAMFLKSSGKEPDFQLVELGAILHDIGRAISHDIDHAFVGAKIATDKGIHPKIREIIKRHIGAGLTREKARILGLPEDDYMPNTLEQKIVAHADNLVMGRERVAIEKSIDKMKKKGIDDKDIERVRTLAKEIGFE